MQEASSDGGIRSWSLAAGAGPLPRDVGGWGTAPQPLEGARRVRGTFPG